MKRNMNILKIQKDLFVKPIMVSEYIKYGYSNRYSFKVAIKKANIDVNAQHMRFIHEDIYFIKETSNQAFNIISKIIDNSNASKIRASKIRNTFIKKEKFIN